MKPMTQSEINQMTSRLRDLLDETRAKFKGTPSDHGTIYPYIALYQDGDIVLNTGIVTIVGLNLADLWKKAEAQLSEDPRQAEIARLKAKLAELEGGAQ